MARVDGTTFTLRQLVFLTKENKKNRFDYMRRDVLKKIQIRNVIELNPDRPSETSRTLLIKSFSYPNYPPYLPTRPKYAKQRTTKHSYDITLSISMDKKGVASVDTTRWKLRIGSQKKWEDTPPQSLIRALYTETTDKWNKDKKKELDAIEKKYTNKKDKAKARTKINEKYKKKKLQHEKAAKYLDIGDFNSRRNGIMGDFRFRIENGLDYFGHLFGKNMSDGFGENYISEPFLDKHSLNLINFLMKKGILK